MRSAVFEVARIVTQIRPLSLTGQTEFYKVDFSAHFPKLHEVFNKQDKLLHLTLKGASVNQHSMKQSLRRQTKQFFHHYTVYLPVSSAYRNALCSDDTTRAETAAV